MALSLLSTEALENIVNRISIDDKSVLIATGNTVLLSKLAQVSTDIAVLPYDEDSAELESLTQDDEGFHATYRYRQHVSMEIALSVSFELGRYIDPDVGSDEEVEPRLEVKAKLFSFGLLPLYYRNAKSAVLFDVHLQQTIEMMRTLEHLRVYLRDDLSTHLFYAPDTLKTLHLDLARDCDLFALIKRIPRTLTSLTMFYDGDEEWIQLDPELIRMLPPNLEILAGVDVNADELARVLPVSLTSLRCHYLNRISPGVLPANLTSVIADEANISSLAHLPLVELDCAFLSNDSLLPLTSLTKLSAYVFWEVRRYQVIEFPPTLTDLTLRTTGPVLCNIPPFVKKLELQGQCNVFELATNTWKLDYQGLDVLAPEYVLHAELTVNWADAVVLDRLMLVLRNVESLSLRIKNNGIGYDFSKFVNCKKLVLSDTIYALSLPPSLTYMDVPYIDGTNRCARVLPASLQHIITSNTLMLSEVKYLTSLVYLECKGDEILKDIGCIARIPTVILRVPEFEKESLPALPSNANYKYY